MPKKGSQLKRFKHSLSTITQKGHGRRKHKILPEKDQERNDKLKRVEEQFNAFDTKFTRSKHEVFGRKLKGKVGKPGLSRGLGEQRVHSLLWSEAYVAEKDGFDERATPEESHGRRR